LFTKGKKWLAALGIGLLALTIGIAREDFNPIGEATAALSSRLNDRLMAMFVDIAGFQKTGIRILSATEGSARLPSRINDRWMQAFASCGSGQTCLRVVGSGGAPVDAIYVTLALDAALTTERVLTGTVNQITITDGGANTTVTLSTPQDIHTGATPTFETLSLNAAVSQIVLDADGSDTGTITLAALGGDQIYTFPDASGEVSLLGQLISLTTEVTGTLPVGSGGMGATSHTDGAILLGNAAGAITNLGVLADDTLILGDGVTDPGTAILPDCDAANDALNYDITTNVISCQSIAGSGAAPSTAQFVTLALDATLTAERVLTGTANQIILVDGGANTTITLSTPQDIHSGASPTFASLSLNDIVNQILFDANGTFTGQLTLMTLTASQTWDLPDNTGTIALVSGIGSGFATEVIDKEATDFTTTLATEESVYTFTVPANALGTDNQIRISITGTMAGGTAATTYRVKYGTTTMMTFEATPGNDPSPVIITMKLMGDDATGAQESSVFLSHNDTNSDTEVGSASEDSTTALTFELTVETTNALQNYTMHHAVAELLR